MRRGDVVFPVSDKVTLNLNSDFQTIAPGDSSAFTSERAIHITSTQDISVIALNKASGSCGG